MRRAWREHEESTKEDSTSTLTSPSSHLCATLTNYAHLLCIVSSRNSRHEQAVETVTCTSKEEGEEPMHMTYGLRHEALVALMRGALVLGMLASGTWAAEADRDASAARRSDFLTFSAPAGERPATTETSIDGLQAAIL